jgi:hypothetical protein
MSVGGGGPGPTRNSPEQDAQRAAYELLVGEMQKARTEGNAERFDELMRRLLNDRDGPGVERQARMDRMRVYVALILIFALLIAVIWAISGVAANGQSTAQYVSLISGLAGIAIGWLYGSSGSSRRTRD